MELDNQKIFHQIDLVHADFTIRASHDRTVEVYNDRLDRWEEELLHDLTASVPLPSSSASLLPTLARCDTSISNWAGFVQY